MSTTSPLSASERAEAQLDVPPGRRPSPVGHVWARVRPVPLPTGSLRVFLALWQLLATSGTWSETLVPPAAKVWDAFVSPGPSPPRTRSCCSTNPSRRSTR